MPKDKGHMGHAIVEIKGVFLENVTINTENTYIVQ